MAKKNKGLDKKKILLGSAGVLGIAGLGYLLYKQGKLASTIDDRQEIPDEDEVGSMEMPEGTPVGIAEADPSESEQDNALAIVGGSTKTYDVASPFALSLSSSQSNGTVKSNVSLMSSLTKGTLRIKNKEPVVRITYDKDHWSDCKLGQYYKVGEKISMNRANDMMRTIASNGPAVTYGYDVINEPKGIYYIEVNANNKKLISSGLGILRNSWFGLNYYTNWKYADKALRNLGFTYVDLDKSGTTKLDLTPGDYIVVIKGSGVHVSDWSYLKGFWEWTKYGPYGVNCRKHMNYLLEDIENIGCKKHVTQFKRVAYINDFDSLVREVKIKSGKTTKINTKVKWQYAVSKRKYKKNSYSKGFYGRCAAMVTVDILSGTGTSQIMNLAKRIGCKTADLLNAEKKEMLKS